LSPAESHEIAGERAGLAAILVKSTAICAIQNQKESLSLQRNVLRTKKDNLQK
jgi:hypothetical protein